MESTSTSLDIQHASSRLTSFLTKCTQEALKNSEIDLDQVDHNRIGVCLGTLASSTSKMLEHIQ